jgi:hypothetical protein
MKDQVKNDFLLKDGDVLIVCDHTFFGSIRKFVTRKSFKHSGLYIETLGVPTVVTNHKGRLVHVYLSVFIKDHKYFTANHVGCKGDFMRRIFNELGKKKNVSELIAEFMEFENPGDYTPDKLYNKLNS